VASSNNKTWPETATIVGLFLCLTVSTGCGSAPSAQSRPGHVHIDKNGDGYCDEDGEPMGSSSTSPWYNNSRYYSSPSVSAAKDGSPSITKGTSPKGGIGGTSVGSGG
jgi:hypothetical protein